MSTTYIFGGGVIHDGGRRAPGVVVPLLGLVPCAAAAALLLGVFGVDVLLSPAAPGLLCTLVFGGFVAIAVTQAPRPQTARPQIVVKSGPKTDSKAAPASVTGLKKAA